ncbi:MAG TPA: hypothetical protein VJ829_04445, partial [Candidatus Binatia bacterium]|nr:hypothetical protein [Candidatus Binatia bacterium]
LLAVAATALLWFQGPTTRQQPGKTPMTVASARPTRVSNQSAIDRIAGRGITIRREPKSGTMIIWVSSNGGEGAR